MGISNEIFKNRGKYLKVMLSFRFVHVKIYWSIRIKNFLSLFNSSVGDTHGTAAKKIYDDKIWITRMIYICHGWVYPPTYRVVFSELSNLKISEINIFIALFLWFDWQLRFQFYQNKWSNPFILIEVPCIFPHPCFCIWGYQTIGVYALYHVSIELKALKKMS